MIIVSKNNNMNSEFDYVVSFYNDNEIAPAYQTEYVNTLNEIVKRYPNIKFREPTQEDQQEFEYDLEADGVVLLGF